MAGQIIPRGERKWLVRVFIGRDDAGKRQYHNRTIHGTKRDAEDILATLLVDRSKGTLAVAIEKRDVGALLDDLLTDYRLNDKDYAWASLLVEKHLRPAFGSIPVSKFVTAHVTRYIDRRKADKRANATINNELALLRRAFSLGATCQPPKVTRIPTIPKLKVNNVRKGFFEHPDYQRLRAALPEHLRPVLTFAYYTGCRRGEILSLTWAQVDLHAGFVRLDPGTTKNDEGRMIPLLTPELRETLRMQRSVRDERWPDSPWVFSIEGDRIGAFRKTWKTACKKAGVSDKLFHDLRRTGVRNLVRAGVPEAVAMRISGHKTRSVFDRYNIVSGADLLEAGRKLTQYLETKQGAVDTQNPAGTLLAHRGSAAVVN